MPGGATMTHDIFGNSITLFTIRIVFWKERKLRPLLCSLLFLSLELLDAFLRRGQRFWRRSP
jgi:hypothetical protein